MTFEKLSKKQKLLLKWAFVPSMSAEYKAVICDGAVRSGKSICMVVAFIMWAMKNFDGAIFGICGKTILSVKRNILMPLQSQNDITSNFHLEFVRSENKLIVRQNGNKNYFYFFSGKDEKSYTRIQGITLSGVMFDEVALMPRTFVEQAVARTLSVDNSKLWFNCNPENPNNYFYKEWIEKAKEKKALYIHFLMDDNPILSKQAIQNAKRMYSGVFYDRYILGQWVAPEGLIYPMFNKEKHIVKRTPPHCEKYIISIDYGTVNPTSAGLWGLYDSRWYRLDEYYFDSRAIGEQKTDSEHYDEIKKLAGSNYVEKIIVDPSAASLITLIRREGRFKVEPASNRVIDGIREVANHLYVGDLLFAEKCTACIKEFSLYSWDKSTNEDKPLKTNDHAMDDTRYFVKSVFKSSLMSFD